MRVGSVATANAPKVSKPWYKLLYIQVLIAIVLATALGTFFPELAKNEWIKLLGDAFIKLIKIAIAPIIFCTIVSGIAHISEAKTVGRVFVKALIYFEVVSTFALAIGLIVGNIAKPGAGVNIPISTTDAAEIEKYLHAEVKHGPAFVLDLIPDTFFSAFTNKDGILQVLVVAIIAGLTLLSLGDRGKVVRGWVDEATQLFFGLIGLIMKLAPIGAFGAMSYTVGKYGPGLWTNLFYLIATFYVTAILFVVIVLGLIARIAGFSIFRFIRYIKDELLLVLGTSSSESALPLLMEKMERLGCSKQVVGLVVPTGYSFNLDGTNIYMTLATLFIAQSRGVDLSLGEQLGILAVAMLTSKGASGVTGSGFITLGATLGTVNGGANLVSGMGMILGIDKFMSECRALTNIIGNAVACVIVAWWEGELDRDKLNEGLSRTVDPTDVNLPATAE